MTKFNISSSDKSGCDAACYDAGFAMEYVKTIENDNYVCMATRNDADFKIFVNCNSFKVTYVEQIN